MKPGNNLPSSSYQFKVKQESTFQSPVLLYRSMQLLWKEDFSAQFHHFCCLYN